MSKPALAKRRLRVPGGIALVLGLEALSAPTRADTKAAQAAPKPLCDSTLTALNDVLVRCGGGRLFLAEAGGNFRPLELADSAATRHLIDLLQKADAAGKGVRLRPTIFAGDGGTGFHWTPTDKSAPRKIGITKARGQQRPVPHRAPSDPPPGEHGVKG